MGFRASLRNRQDGFTLVELIFVVAIVGILAALAYPSYADHVRRGRIAEALGELATSRVRMEQYYQDNRNYGTTLSTCGVSLPSATAFNFSCSWGTTSTSQTFVVTATGNGPLAGYAYTVDDANAQRTTLFDNVATSATCWLRKRGDTC